MQPPVDRRQLLARLGGGADEIDELLAYGEPAEAERPPAESLADEPHLEVWADYQRVARTEGVVAALTGRLPQMSFPVEQGISSSPAYRASTRRGEEPPPSLEGSRFVRPEQLQLRLVETPAGRLPVLVAPHREDFECLVRVLSARNEPVPVPSSMGACLVKGFVNWDRVNRYRRRWEAENPGAEWGAELRRWTQVKSRYQDTFLLLSEGPYSGIPASEMALEEWEWMRCSLVIRLAHEATHYVTLRLLGYARNHAWDELLADFVGIVAGAGRYRSDWALRFLGVERSGRFVPGGRLGNYRGRPPLSDAAFELLVRLVVPIVDQLEKLAAAGWQPSLEDPRLARLLRALAPLTLEEMAEIDLVSLLEGSG